MVDDDIGLGVCAGDGDGEAGDDESSFTQAIANIKTANAIARRNDTIRSFAMRRVKHTH
jgi:hypothetical protein